MNSSGTNAGALPPISPGSPLMPDDFALRLTALKELTGLPWAGLASLLGVDSRQLWRWRNGVAPNGGAVLALVRLALHVPGGLAALLGDDVPVIHLADGGGIPGDGPTGERGEEHAEDGPD